MLTIKSQGLKLADLRTSPITEIMALFFEYQNASEDMCHNLPRVLAMGGDLHAVLEGTEYDYNIRFLNRHYTICIYEKHQEYFEMTDTMHPLEVFRITETEEGR